MTPGQIVVYIAVPLTIFVLTSLGAAVAGVVKLTNYFSRTQLAVESTAVTNKEIAENLKQFIGETNKTLTLHGERLSVLEDRVKC